MSGIEVFTPLVRVLTVNGLDVEVAPLKARRFAAFQTAVAPIWAALARGDVGALVGAHYDSTRAAVLAAVEVNGEWLDGQEPGAVLDILAAALEVNEDFSRRRLDPAMGRFAETVVTIVTARKAGAASSPASDNSATPSPSPST